MPKVSVIVPVYNVECYIEKCMETLVNQTLNDIEIIVVNDGSTDKSKKILKEYEKNYPSKIKYLEKENGGLSDARNYGIPYATGEYIAFLDSDDYVEIDTYEKMYAKAKEDDSDYVECDFIWEYSKKYIIDKAYRYDGKKGMLLDGRVVAWNKLIRRKIILDSKIEFPKGLRYEDIEFFYKIIPFLEKVSFVDEPLIHYVQRKNSISNNQNERNKEVFTVLDNVIKYYKKNGIYDEYKNELEFTYTRITLCSSLQRITKIKNKNTRKVLETFSWDNLNSVFPDWKKNRYLRERKSAKNIYMRLVNRYTFKIFCKIFEIKPTVNL